MQAQKIDLSTVKTMSAEDAMAAGLYEVIGKEIDDKYIAYVKAQVVNQDAIDKMQKDITIVYTPLHGTGNIPVRRVLKEIGFENVYVVPEQELPDGDFPTVSYPNPEAAEAFALGLKLAEEKNADLVLATDPDADRLGVYVKDTKSGKYISLTGNMSGSLLCEYVLSQKAAKNAIPADGEVVKSIVSTNLIDAVAASYNCKLVECLTGFKWIGQQIDLRAGGGDVGLGVGRVDELAGNEAVGESCGQFLRLGNGSLHAQRAVRQHQFRAVGLQQVAAFHAHRFRHGQDDRS